ncbi:MAG: transposase [Nitrospira sp.]
MKPARPFAEICRQVGIAEQTFYTWKRKYAGLGLSELRELRQLREKNTKLKRLVADKKRRSICDSKACSYRSCSNCFLRLSKRRMIYTSATCKSVPSLTILYIST